MKRKWRVVVGILLLGSLALFAWGFWFEPRRLLVREVELQLPGWPADLDGVRIAVLADLHVGSPHHGLATLRRIVDRTNDARPDLVLIPGDIVIHGVVGGRFVAPEQAAPELARLTPSHGVFGVLGNHDWWLDAPRVTAALQSAGVTMLEDTAAKLDVGSASFWLAGVSDYWEGAHDVRAALRTVPDGEPVILFTHNPDVFPEVPSSVSLTVAGHTHGGQVNLPLVGRPIVPSQYGQRYAAGHIVERGRHLYVSVGTGTSILPVRFRVPPEIVVLTVRSTIRG